MEAASVRAGATTERRRSKGVPERRLAVMMVAPSIILIAIVGAWPIIYAIWLSLHEYSVRVAGLSGWAGFDNYSNALSSSAWAAAFARRIPFTVSSVLFETLIGLGMALCMHAALKRQGLLRPTVL